MPKISISLPAEVLSFVDTLGSNRSSAIASILKKYQRKKEEALLARAYDDYARLCRDDDADWWPAWEASSARDLESRE